MWVFEVNDIALTLWKDRELILREPGIANVIESSIVFGDHAIRQYKERPALCHSQYWQKLNQEPTVRTSDGVATQADLIYQHVKSMKERVGLDRHATIRIVVPNDATNAQLELLYGIFDYVDLNVTDFVAAAISACQVIMPVSHYLDIGLNRALLTELSVEAELQIGDSQPLARSGYIALLSAWTNEVARVSLEESRFDPRKFGSTEQQVFNQFLDNPFTSNDLHIDIEHRRGTHHVSVKAEELLKASVEVFEPIGTRLHPGSTVVLSPHATKLTGLGDYLISLGHTVKVCSEQMLLDSIIGLDAPSSNESNERVVHRSFTLDRSLDTGESSQARIHQVTHVLTGSHAAPLHNEFVANVPNGDGEYFRLVRQDGSQTLIPSEVMPVYWNGQRINSPLSVEPGDKIHCADVEFLLITVTADG